MLVCIICDACDSNDIGHVVLLEPLDMSPAFYTVDHDILLTRFNTSYGGSGQLLVWLCSFLEG